MVVANCSYPRCTSNTSDIVDALVVMLLQIHACGSHSAGTPYGGQNNANSKIQLHLLSDTNQNMTLEDVFQFVKKKEIGKRSANRLLESQGVESITSQYKQNHCQGVKDMILNKSDPCGFCRKCGHGKNSTSDLRKQYYHAYNSKLQLLSQAPSP